MSYFDLDSNLQPSSYPIFGQADYSNWDEPSAFGQDMDMIEFNDDINPMVDNDDFELQSVIGGANSDVNLFTQHRSPYYEKTLMN